MRLIFIVAAATIFSGAAYAQQPDTTRRPPVTRADSLRADSIAAADSIQLVRELERIGNEPRPVMGPQTATAGPQNPQLLPNISAIGDLIADFSPDGSTQESANRFDIREVEVALQAAVDPYFRGDVILGLSDLEGIAIEEAYLTTLALPRQFQIRAGRFHMPVGKQNTTHRPELHTIEYPHVIQRFLGEEGLKGTGLWLSKIFAPFGFYQEVLVTAIDRLGGEAHGHEEEEEGRAEPVAAEPANKSLSGLGYSARLRNYWDISEATNIELSASAATGKQAQGVDCFGFDDPGEPIPCGLPGDATAVNVRQSLVGADFTFRWRPLQQGLYKSFIFQTEYFRQLNDESPPIRRNPGVVTVYDGPVRNFDGAYAFARYQVARRTFVGGRFDWLRDPEAEGETFSAASAYLTFFPSEFSKLVAGFERTNPSGDGRGLNRILIQATFALGPHRPHPF